jgi:hypothetical protein
MTLRIINTHRRLVSTVNDVLRVTARISTNLPTRTIARSMNDFTRSGTMTLSENGSQFMGGELL